MPIEYKVSPDGNFIHAIASGQVTSQEFVDYEIAHAIDKRIKSPVSELLEIRINAFRNVSRDDIAAVFERRKEMVIPHTRHRCAIVVSIGDSHAWNLAKFYEGMAALHSPEAVIVFGDLELAKVWLGIEFIEV
jgi:hypothetical protein